MKTKYDQYLKTYYGVELLKKHSLDKYGVWRVRGEDPNCDLGGSHHMPDLGNYEGRLEDVIRYAVELGSFWSWGGGGEISLASPPIKVDKNTVERLAELRIRKAELDAELNEVNRQLKELA